MELVFIVLIFVWTGFVRSGLGFGGAALGLPLMLLVLDKPIFWLPMLGVHLLFFTSLTIGRRLSNVDWAVIRMTLTYLTPTVLIGIMGLITLPNEWLVIFVYSVALFYATTWVLGIVIQSQNKWVDRFLLLVGGYVAGTSLTGAPLIVAVVVRHVQKSQLRDTLFVLWFSIVSVKMFTFIVLEIELHFTSAVSLLPFAFMGHLVGLRLHDLLLKEGDLFKRLIGAILIVISVVGLGQVFW